MRVPPDRARAGGFSRSRITGPIGPLQCAASRIHPPKKSLMPPCRPPVPPPFPTARAGPCLVGRHAIGQKAARANSVASVAPCELPTCRADPCSRDLASRTRPAGCPLSPVPCPLSPVPCPLSPVPYSLFPIPCHAKTRRPGPRVPTPSVPRGPRYRYRAATASRSSPRPPSLARRRSSSASMAPVDTSMERSESPGRPSATARPMDEYIAA